MENVQFQNTELPDLIELRNINQSYDGKTNVIDGLNMLIEDKPNQGQFVCLLGASGSGKSTLLRYIAGLQKPTSGEVLIHGKPRTEKTVVSMVFQKYTSLPWLSVLENVALGLKLKGVPKKEREEKAMEFIQIVGLDGQESKFAKSPELSGGQLQRVAIARSLLANPEIILFDEPFGALDIRTRLRMQEMVAGIWSKLHCTVVFVTHDISEAVYLADEIFILKSKPARIVDRILVDLPLIRHRDIKREQKFIHLAQQIEDKIMNLENRVSP